MNVVDLMSILKQRMRSGKRRDGTTQDDATQPARRSRPTHNSKGQGGKTERAEAQRGKARSSKAARARASSAKARSGKKSRGNVRNGEASRGASRSRKARSTGRDGGKRSRSTDGAGATLLQRASKQVLYERAQALDIPGRSKMSREELLKSVQRAS
jgi:DNA end-binding protein Ku